MGEEMTDNGEDHFCSIEGTGIRDRLDNLRNMADKSERDRLQRKAVDALRSLREELDSGNLEQWRAIEKAKRVVDELFDAMGW